MSRRFPIALSLATLLVASGCSTTPTSPSAARRAEAAPAPPPVAAAPAQGTPSIWPGNAPQIFAQSAIMIDARSGRVLFQKNADQTRAVASTQKLLTALLALERGSLSDSIRIEAADTRVEPVKLGIRSGEVYAKRDLLGAIMVRSSNDAAAALARHHSGSVAGFSHAMNRKARELGAENSWFLNPHGLTEPGQYSTARDIARIAFHAYQDPTIRHYAQMQSIPFRYNSGRVVTLKATNKLLERSPAYTGLKTGYTNASGRCLVTTANAGGTTVLIVQLGSKTRHIFDDAENLVHWQRGRSFFNLASNPPQTAVSF